MVNYEKKGLLIKTVHTAKEKFNTKQKKYFSILPIHTNTQQEVLNSQFVTDTDYF